jgi:hypothetical protein
MKQPKGFVATKGHTKVAINFPDPLFKDIIRMANAAGKPFNFMVVDLCRVGKLCLDESDALEPIA